MKKLRRQQIDSHKQAQGYLEGEYLPEHHRRLARPAAQAEDYHRRAPRATERDRIFRLESARTIRDDCGVGYDNRFFQLQPQSRHSAPAQGQVGGWEGRDRSLAIESRGHALPWQQIPAPARARVPEARPGGERGTAPASPAPRLAQRKWVPPADHPWRQAARVKLLSGSGLRSALNAPPFGLRRAPLRPEPKSNTKSDTKNETLSRGHF